MALLISVPRQFSFQKISYRCRVYIEQTHVRWEDQETKRYCNIFFLRSQCLVSRIEFQRVFLFVCLFVCFVWGLKSGLFAC
jgi:hypothetical protein